MREYMVRSNSNSLPEGEGEPRQSRGGFPHVLTYIFILFCVLGFIASSAFAKTNGSYIMRPGDVIQFGNTSCGYAKGVFACGKENWSKGSVVVIVLKNKIEVGRVEANNQMNHPLYTIKR